MEQLDGDEQLAREVIGLFLRESPGQLSAIETALDLGDLNGASVSAHTLKGAASTLAAPEVAKAAEAVERCARDGRLAEAREARRQLEAAMARLHSMLEAALLHHGFHPGR
jgi:HPt (histidine-containing phosphotransfer) domain-containing protein